MIKTYKINDLNEFTYTGKIKDLKFDKKNQRFPLKPLVYFDLSSPIIIEKDVSFSNGVRVYTHTHKFSRSDWRELGPVKKLDCPFIFKEGSFIGTNTLILFSCNYVGKYSVIGAGSVVLDSIPDYEIWVGNPAKKISDIKIIK